MQEIEDELKRIEDISKLCTLDQQTPIAFIYGFCHDNADMPENEKKQYHGGLVVNTDETTVWFITIFDILLGNFKDMPDVQLCKKLSALKLSDPNLDSKYEKEVFMPPIIEKINNAKPVRGCKDCTKYSTEMFKNFKKNNTTYSDYGRAVKKLWTNFTSGSTCYHYSDKHDIRMIKYDEKENSYFTRVEQIKKIIDEMKDHNGMIFVGIEYWDDAKEKLDHKIRVFKDEFCYVPAYARKLVLVAHLLKEKNFEDYEGLYPQDTIICEFIKKNNLK